MTPEKTEEERKLIIRRIANLIDGHKRVLSELYSPKRYFERCVTLLGRLSPETKMVRSTSWVEIRGLLLSLLKQGSSSRTACGTGDACSRFYGPVPGSFPMPGPLPQKDIISLPLPEKYTQRINFYTE